MYIPVFHVPYIISLNSFSKMYKYKSGWQKRKERAVREENHDPTKLIKT